MTGQYLLLRANLSGEQMSRQLGIQLRVSLLLVA